MTSQGSALTRLRRVISMPGSSALQIRAAAAELPRIGLEDAMAILLALSDREPTTFAKGAARWGARLTLERLLALAEAQLVLAALAALPTAGAARRRWSRSPIATSCTVWTSSWVTGCTPADLVSESGVPAWRGTTPRDYRLEHGDVSSRCGGHRSRRFCSRS